jgi:hypothetical protein
MIDTTSGKHGLVSLSVLSGLGQLRLEAQIGTDIVHDDNEFGGCGLSDVAR